MNSTKKPPKRHILRGAIHAAGYNSASAFSKSIQYDNSGLNAVLNGWRYPSPELQRKLREGLGITQAQLIKLL
ncbi:MAG: hypothetical protein JSW39_22775 [Desulfobacterales bacterium]|nr:MAG: hypothetical protein JSW39_22775 [Desulfobacterales bacterium]